MIDTSTPFSLVTQVSGALAIVLLAIVVFAWLARRCGFNVRAGMNGTQIAVKGSYSLGQRERLVVVEVDGQRLLLGVTPGAITRLDRLSKSDESAPSVPADFQQTLKRLLKRGKAEPEQ